MPYHIARPRVAVNSIDNTRSILYTRSMEQKFVRKVVALTPEQWKRVEDYRYANRLPSEVEAIRRLIEAALAGEKKGRRK